MVIILCRKKAKGVVVGAGDRESKEQEEYNQRLRILIFLQGGIRKEKEEWRRL